MSVFVPFTILFLVNCVETSLSHKEEGPKNRVLLRDIDTLTLVRGKFSTAVRAQPIPQLQRAGGNANEKFSPDVVQCYNRGWDGRDVQWECKAIMHPDYQFGKIEISCEGYDFPEDPYIWAGSCGMKYELNWSPSGERKQREDEDAFWDLCALIFVIIVIVCIVLWKCPSSLQSSSGGRRSCYDCRSFSHVSISSTALESVLSSGFSSGVKRR